jgi:hypothetical protein
MTSRRFAQHASAAPSVIKRWAPTVANWTDEKKEVTLADALSLPLLFSLLLVVCIVVVVELSLRYCSTR